MKSKIVYIVDDNPIWVNTLTEVLYNLGCSNIIAFTNGTDCINNLYQNPALVFLDYHLIDMDGIEVLQTIKHYSSETAVVFFTDNNKMSVAVNAMKNGSFDYLIKSNISNKGLLPVVKNIAEQIFMSAAIC
ncbi:MAG: response regulator [Ferruginibacter sp.]